MSQQLITFSRSRQRRLEAPPRPCASVTLPSILAKIDEHLGGGVVIDPVAAVSAITLAVSSTFMCRSSNGVLHLE